MGKSNGKRPTKPKGNGKHPAGKKPTPGCYVLSLTVENIRCFGPKQTLDCSDGEGRPRQWTVILGDNGTGKTTLLRILNACRSVFVERMGHPVDARVGSHQSSATLTGGRGHFEVDTVKAGSVTLSLKTPPAESGWEEWRRVSDEDGDRVVDAIDFYGYDVDRRCFRDNAPPLLLHFGERPPQRPTSGDPVRDAEDWLIALDYSASKSDSGEQARWLELARATLLTVLSYGKANVSAMKCLPGSGPVPQSRVVFKTPDGWLTLRQLGHGYQAMIAWVVDLVSRMIERHPDSESPLAEPAVCLVDEIDLHLHPVWQRKVIGYLSERFQKTQFIVTAHSPLVVQAAASANANIAVLVRSTEKDADGHHYVEIKNNPEDVRDWRLDQILTSDLFGGIDLRSAETAKLFARKRELLDKGKRTKAEEAELADLETQIATLPVGDSVKFKDDLQLLRDALDALKPMPQK